MANQWFRLYAEFATDQKVQMLSEVNQRRLIMLFCLRCNDNVTLHDDEVTFLLRISNEEWLATKSLFIAKGFINNDNEVLNWDKRQYISDSSAERVARHRAKKKQACNVTVTAPDTDTDTDTDTEHKKHIPEKSEKTKSKKPKSPDDEIDYPEWLDLEAFNRFKEHRKSIKSPMTPASERLAISKLNELFAKGHSQADVINESILNNWKGLFEPRGMLTTQAKQKPQNVPRSHGAVSADRYQKWLESGEEAIEAEVIQIGARK
jgi:hypothetical protein